MVGDADGVIVVPASMAADVAKEAVEMTIYEDFVADMVKRGHSIIGLYPMTDLRNEIIFQKWKAENRL